jgi:hypothetical protein
MVKRTMTVVAVGLVILAWAGHADARGFFDNLVLSPRARALGGAYVALSDDESAVFTNPAALAGQEGIGVYSSYVDLFGYDFHYLGSIAASIPSKYGTFGLGGRAYAVEYEGEDLASEYSAVLGHGFTVMEDVHSSLSFGYALSFYGLTLGESVGGEDLGSASAFGLDVGVLGTLRGRTRVGFFAKNINNPKMGEPDAKDLPQWFTAGICYSPYGGVNTCLEIQKQDNEELRGCAGFEFEIAEYLVLRGGIQNQPDRLSAGFGTHWKQIHVDYSYTSHPVLPGTHHYGLRLSF